MKIGPKYKIAKRLGAPIFEKTQTQKFALSQARKSGAGQKGRKHMSPVTDYGIQMKEKQKARYTYLLTEKQFSKYVKNSLSHKSSDKAGFLFSVLESRLDNIILRAGFAPTRSAARQMVSHGHVTVNQRKNNIPSYLSKIGDKISIRPQSLGSGLFADFEKNQKEFSAPNWLKVDVEKKEIEVVSRADLKSADNLFDLNLILEFYSR